MKELNQKAGGKVGDRQLTPAQYLASLINGRQYRNELTEADIAYAREHKLLICYAASDDLAEVRGFVDEEFSVGDNTFTASFNEWGYRPTWEQLTESDIVTQHDYRKWFEQECLPVVEVRWEFCPDGYDLTWLVSASCPSTELFDGDTLFTVLCCEVFDVMEGGEVFCRGLVVDMSLLSAPSHAGTASEHASSEPPLAASDSGPGRGSVGDDQ